MSFERHPIVAAHLDKLEGKELNIVNYQVFLLEKLSRALYEELKTYEEQEAINQKYTLAQQAERTKAKLLDKIHEAVEQDNLEAVNILSQALQRVFL